MRLSVSSVGTWLTCRRRWLLEHVLKLEQETLPTSLVAGSLFHQALDKALGGQSPEWDVPLLRRAYDPVVALAKAKAGFQLCDLNVFGKVVETEKRIEQEVDGVTWLAFIDAIVEDELGFALVDHKLTTRSRWDWFRAISDQLLLYACLLRGEGYEVTHGIWNVVCLPTLRTRLGEDAESLAARYVEKARENGPGQVLMPVTFTKTDFAIGLEKLEQIGQEIQRGKIFRNPAACAAMPCPYELICLDERNAKLLGYIERKENHLGGWFEET